MWLSAVECPAHSALQYTHTSLPDSVALAYTTDNTCTDLQVAGASAA